MCLYLQLELTPLWLKFLNYVDMQSLKLDDNMRYLLLNTFYFVLYQF